MSYTPTPNILFDQLLKDLSISELKILLIIIRQTYGWIDKKTGRRKERDRILYSQFINKTGLSRRIISEAINSLSEKRLIKISDSSGNILNTAKQRKGQFHIFYSPSLLPVQSLHIFPKNTYAKNDTQPVQKSTSACAKSAHNKRNYINRNYTKEKEIDFKHIKEILDEKRIQWSL